MNITQLIALFPKRARKIPVTDVVRYFNGPVIMDLYDMICAYAPNEFVSKITYTVSFPTKIISSFAVDPLDATLLVLTSVAHGFEIGDIIDITSTPYNGKFRIQAVTEDTISISETFSVDSIGTFMGPSVHTLPPTNKEIISIVDDKFGEVWETVTSETDDTNFTGVSVVGDNVIVPIGSLLTELVVTYQMNVTAVVDGNSELPFSRRVLEAVQNALIYGICLYFYRERKKATEMQIYIDLYNEAKATRLQMPTVFTMGE